MRFRNFDLILVIVIVVLNIVWTQVPYHFIVIGIFLALPLTLFVPGYALTQVLFRRREGQISSVANGPIRRPELKIGHPIGAPDQIVLSLGLSMAIDVLVGFGLNILPIGLQTLSWVLSLGLLTMVFVVVAILLRRKDVLNVAKLLQIHILAREYALFILATFIVGAAVWFSIIRPLNPQPSFTQFWGLPVNQTNKSCVVSFGVQSFENSSETYFIVLTVNNALTNTWSSITLAPQQKWTREVALVPGASTSIYVEAQLYRIDKPHTVYRNIHLTLYVSSVNLNGHIQKKCISKS